jgi:hypothetical protein
MGVEFSQTTAGHRVLLEKFLHLLTENRDVMPELMVDPEGLGTETSDSTEPVSATHGEAEDTLLELFRNQALSADSFHLELSKQRGLGAAAGVSA